MINMDLSLIPKNSLIEFIKLIKSLLLENYNKDNCLWKTNYRTITSVRNGVTINIDSWDNRISISIIGKE